MKNSLNDYFKGCLYFTAGSLYRRVERMAVRAFADLGIAPIHAFIIMAIADAKDRGEDLNPSDVAEVMELDKSTVTRHLIHLEKLKFVQRGKEGRVVSLTLTKEGTRLVPKIESAWSDLYKKYSAYWGEMKANSVNDQIYKLISSTKK